MTKPTRVKLAIVHAGISQEELAHITGIPRNTISRIVHGQTPNLRNAQKVAKALEKTVDELWPLEDNEE